MKYVDKERLIEVLGLLRENRIILTQAEFAQKTGINPSQISEMIKGTRKISERTVRIIVARIPIINEHWLLTGEGPMLKEAPDRDTALTEYNPILNNTDTVPLLPVSAIGGSLNDFVASVMSEDCERIVSPIKGVDFAISVTGNSMAPEYPNGSKVLIKRIDEKAFIEWGRVYVLDTRNGSVIKKIMPGSNDNCVRCESLNPDYPDFEVCFADMFGMYRVLMLLTEK